MRDFIKAFALEYRTIFRNGGIMIVLVFAPLFYSLLYSSGYAKEVLYNVPIAVIDHSHTASSREVIVRLNASPYIYTAFQYGDILEAQKALMERKIYGIVYIPKEFEERINSGNQAVVSLYCDAGYFLMYRQIMQGATGAIFSLNNSLAPQLPVIYQSHTLFNPYLGYGTFIMPAVLIVILQQTAMVAICMAGGVWRKERLYDRFSSSIVVTAAKVMVYCSICAVIASYILGIHYHIFGYPMCGSTADICGVIIPFILSTVLFAITLSTLFSRAEQPLMYLLWTSIPILLLSGASLPPQAFPQWMYILGKIFPSSSAVEAFIRVQTMGGTLDNVTSQTTTLWILSLIYGITATIAIKRRMPGRTTKSRTSNLLP